MAVMLFRAIIQGDAGSGKNGLLAGASDHRIIIASFEPLTSEVTKVYATHPENVHIVPFSDDWIWDEDRGMTRKGKAALAMEQFIYAGRPMNFDKKEPPPFGHPRSWGAETIFTLDTLTALGESCERRQTELNPTMPYYSNAYQGALDQEKIVQLMLTHLNCHVMVLSHLRLDSPKAESTFDRNETNLQKQIKRERAALQETGFFPTMVTAGIARNVVRHFPFALLTEESERARNPAQRILRTQPVPGYRIKCPLEVEDKLPIETALATILAKL